MKMIELLVKIFPSICAGLRWLFKHKPNRGTVLIVEDNEHDALALERALRRVGYECEIACTAEVAQGFIGGAKFSIIFVDLRLPGMPGEALLRVLSDQAPNARVVIVCGEPADLRAMPDGKPVVMIRKPVNVNGLVELFGLLNLK